jgi:hypothetical protein
MWSRIKPDRSVHCHDVAGRRRTVVVHPTGTGHVTVIIPPGEVAELTADEALHLWTVLRLAVIDAAGVQRPDPPAHGAARYRKLRGMFAVPCLDAIGRDDRAVTITPIGDGRVSITAPAGGAAVLAPLQVGALRGALRDAASWRCPQPTEASAQRRRVRHQANVA